MAEQQVRMKVEGMTCTSCEGHVINALEEAGARNIKVSFRQNEAQFSVSEQEDLARFTHVVAETGYRPGNIEIMTLQLI
jgi:mercuric reductase